MTAATPAPLPHAPLSTSATASVAQPPRRPGVVVTAFVILMFFTVLGLLDLGIGVSIDPDPDLTVAEYVTSNITSGISLAVLLASAIPFWQGREIGQIGLAVGGAMFLLPMLEVLTTIVVSGFDDASGDPVASGISRILLIVVAPAAALLITALVLLARRSTTEWINAATNHRHMNRKTTPS
ncbi:hypothetical protein [Stackebrandtia soli]|uniref:hypothetical protein n=1 Tax=Stackebrandtia soli TaxID=1892856 RepID=UPI0039EAEC17